VTLNPFHGLPFWWLFFVHPERMVQQLSHYYVLLAEYMVQKTVMAKLVDDENFDRRFRAKVDTLPLPCPAWRWDADFLQKFEKEHQHTSWWPIDTITGAFALARHRMLSSGMRTFKAKALVKLVAKKDAGKRERRRLTERLEESVKNTTTRRWADNDAPSADTLPPFTLYDSTQVQTFWPWHKDDVLDHSEDSSSDSVSDSD
jgi:hypothetical protein